MMSFKQFLYETTENKGAFHRWLGKSEGEPITAADIAKGKAAGGHAKKMAIQAQNFHPNEFKEDLDESEKGSDPYNSLLGKGAPRKGVRNLRISAMKMAQKKGVDPRNSHDSQAKAYKNVYAMRGGKTLAGHAVKEDIDEAKVEKPKESEEKKKCTHCGVMFTPTWGEHARCPSCLARSHAAAEKATHVESTNKVEKINSKEALEKAEKEAEKRAEKAQKKNATSYIEMLKKALRRIKGRKNLDAKDLRGLNVEEVSQEELDAIYETISKDADSSTYVDDFVHSKNKMFKGDSKKQRIRRALGAYYGKKNEELELEPIEELSKKTLGSYIKKSVDDIDDHSYAIGRVSNRSNFAQNRKSTNNSENRIAQRRHGIKKALHRLTKEETLTEELSDAALELVHHAANNSDLHRSSHIPIINNLKKKAKKGVYHPELAKKLWKYHADRVAQSYHKEHGDKHTTWHHMFSTSDRHQAAAHWEAHHRHEVLRR